MLFGRQGELKRSVIGRGVVDGAGDRVVVILFLLATQS